MNTIYRYCGIQIEMNRSFNGHILKWELPDFFPADRHPTPSAIRFFVL